MERSVLNPHIKPMLKLSQTRLKKPDIDGLNPIPRKEHHLLDAAFFQACESSGWPLGILHSTSHVPRARGPAQLRAFAAVLGLEEALTSMG